jgi:hypothetical protein
MKAQDVMVALKLLNPDAPQGYALLGQSVGLIPFRFQKYNNHAFWGSPRRLFYAPT